MKQQLCEEPSPEGGIIRLSMSWEVWAPPWKNKEEGPALSMMVQLWNSKVKPLERRRRRGRPRTWPSTFQKLMGNTDSADRTAAIEFISAHISSSKVIRNINWFNQLMSPTSTEKVTDDTEDPSSCSYVRHIYLWLLEMRWPLQWPLSISTQSISRAGIMWLWTWHISYT